MRKAKLSSRDIGICLNLQKARERLGLTQSEVARQLVLERTTLQNYEYCRTPLRFEIALKFCRQFIVSEEWLATGKCEMCRAQAVKIGAASSATGPESDFMETEIYFRQCLDLWSEPATRHIRTGMLFSEAWDAVHSKEYKRLISSFLHYPRILFTDADNKDLAINFLTAINKRFMLLLSSIFDKDGKPSQSVWRAYTLHMTQLANLVFHKMSGIKLHPEDFQDLNWLRDFVFKLDAARASGEREIALTN